MSEARATILVIDDEPQIRRFLRTSLDIHGYGIEEAPTAAEGLRLATTGRPDLIVLDLGLPDRDGLDVLQAVREWSRIPIFVLSVRGRETDKVKALNLGADDYITKPFGMAEFLARVQALLRRASPDEPAQPVFAVGGLEVDLARRVVRVDGRDVRLSPKQYRLLQILVAHAGKVVTHQHLLTALWGPANTEDSQYLRIFVRKLRRRIEPNPSRPRYLVTELGVGYRLRTPDQLPPAGR